MEHWINADDFLEWCEEAAVPVVRSEREILTMMPDKEDDKYTAAEKEFHLLLKVKKIRKRNKNE